MINDIIKLESKDELSKVRFDDDFDGALKVVLDKMDKEFDSLKSDTYSSSVSEGAE